MPPLPVKLFSPQALLAAAQSQASRRHSQSLRVPWLYGSAYQPGNSGDTLETALRPIPNATPDNQRSGNLPVDGVSPEEFITRNIAITTSGVRSDVSLRYALDAMGHDNVMFSVDYPFEKTELAAHFIEGANIAETDRAKVASENARRILHLDRPALATR